MVYSAVTALYATPLFASYSQVVTHTYMCGESVIARVITDKNKALPLTVVGLLEKEPTCRVYTVRVRVVEFNEDVRPVVVIAPLSVEQDDALYGIQINIPVKGSSPLEDVY